MSPPGFVFGKVKTSAIIKQVNFGGTLGSPQFEIVRYKRNTEVIFSHLRLPNAKKSYFHKISSSSDGNSGWGSAPEWAAYWCR